MSQESVVSLRTRPWDKGLCVGGGSDTPVPHLDHRSRGWGIWHDSHRLGVRLRSSFFYVCIVGDLDGVFLFTRRLAV